MADTTDSFDPTNTAAGAASKLDTLTGTTADKRADFIAKAQEALTDVVATAVDKVKANPKIAAAIAAGATAAVAGAAFGATKLAKGAKAPAKPRTTTTKRAPAKRTPTAKK
jgi:hypothetical protein